jgi:hypothetical protein
MAPARRPQAPSGNLAAARRLGKLPLRSTSSGEVTITGAVGALKAPKGSSLADLAH